MCPDHPHAGLPQGPACILALTLSVLLPLVISSDPTHMHTTTLGTTPTRLAALPIMGILPSIRGMAGHRGDKLGSSSDLD